jgi:hypothetical protein
VQIRQLRHDHIHVVNDDYSGEVSRRKQKMFQRRKLEREREYMKTRLITQKSKHFITESKEVGNLATVHCRTIELLYPRASNRY